MTPCLMDKTICVHQLFLLPKLDYYSFFLKCFSHMTYNNTADTKVMIFRRQEFSFWKIQIMSAKNVQVKVFLSKLSVQQKQQELCASSIVLGVYANYKWIHIVRREERLTFSQPIGTKLKNLY